MIKSLPGLNRLKAIVRSFVRPATPAPVDQSLAQTDATYVLKQACIAFGDPPVALFDEAWYLTENPDVAADGIDPFKHFLESGWHEGRAPSRNFNTVWYLEANPDVRAAQINPLIHYIESGATEGRAPVTSELVRGLGAVRTEFDAAWYLNTYADVAQNGSDPFHHYLDHGWREGRDPSPAFSTGFYLTAYPEVHESGLDPLSHYVAFGRNLGYATRPDVAATPVQGDGARAQPIIENLALVEFAFPKLPGAGLIVETVNGGHIKGAAFNPGSMVTEIEILAGTRSLVSTLCVSPRSDIELASSLPRQSGFSLSLPLRSRYEAPNDLGIRFRGKPSSRRALAWSGCPNPRVLVIANAASKSDGSRIYRAELPASQLRESGVETLVLSQEEAVKRIQETALNPADFDVVIFQRVPEVSSVVSLLDAAKRRDRLVLYDVDDLMFKPWRRAEMGVIRSGMVQFNDQGYAESLSKRLKMMMQCDAVICSTPFLQRELKSLGMPAILSRNAVDDAFFSHGAMRLARKPKDSRFRLMFMSGTPTHEADFKPISGAVQAILARNPDVTLTILGELRSRELDTLPNVERIPVVSRHRMFEIVAQQDLILVPLERTAFNTAKSSLKFMEAGAAGVPVIASDLFEFERDIRNSGGGRIARTPAEWFAAIQDYVDDRDLSRQHGYRAFQYCLENYSTRSRRDYLWSEICRFDAFLSQQSALAAGYSHKISSRRHAVGSF